MDGLLIDGQSKVKNLEDVRNFRRPDLIINVRKRIPRDLIEENIFVVINEELVLEDLESPRLLPYALR